MTRVGNHASLSLSQNLIMRYGLDRGTGELPIEDFEIMPNLRLSFEIVTGTISVRAIGHIW